MLSLRCEYIEKEKRCHFPALPVPMLLEDEQGVTGPYWFCPRHFITVKDMLMRRERLYWLIREIRKLTRGG